MTEQENDDLEQVSNFIFDLDNTVWYWNRLAPGVKETIRKLKARDKRIFYATNNSLLTRQGFADKLTNLGLNTEPDHIVSSSYVAARVFAANNIQHVHAVGEQGLVEQLEQEHVNIRENADHVVIGFDRNFTFWKMAKAAELVQSCGCLVPARSSKQATEFSQLTNRSGKQSDSQPSFLRTRYDDSVSHQIK